MGFYLPIALFFLNFIYVRILKNQFKYRTYNLMADIRTVNKNKTTIISTLKTGGNNEFKNN